MKITIRYTVPADAAPPGHSLSCWEPDFLITGSFEEQHDEFRRWMGLEITEVRCVEPAYGSHPRRRWKRLEASLRELIETDMKLRHSIEELLVEAARERTEAMREAG
jgi:hypothetical protein